MQAKQHVLIGDGIQVGVFSLFGGHHCVWASSQTQADICNNADDLVVLNCTTGKRHRFPITAEFLPWLRQLLETMNAADKYASSPWSDHNAGVRAVLVDAAARVLTGDPRPQLNILQPPLIAPAIWHSAQTADEMLLSIIRDQPESLIT